MEPNIKKPKKKPMKLEDMTKDQIREAIIKKRECNAKAQQIVESLLERGVTEKYLLQCLPDINQTHFQDIVEERSIIHLCGYPICQKTLSVKDIPKQKYRISLKTNKVYDITARKNFCSNACYNAAMHVEKQMLTSPLWFREYEEVPQFNLLPLSTSGGMGEEVDVTLIDRIKISERKPFTSINEFAQVSLKDVPDSALDSQAGEETTEKETNSSNKEVGDLPTETNNLSILNTINSNETNNKENKTSNKQVDDLSTEMNDLNILNKMDSNEHKDKDTNLNNNITEIKPEQPKIEASQAGELQKPISDKPTVKKTNPNPFNIVGDIIEKPEKKIDPILTANPTPVQKVTDNKERKKKMQKKQPLVTALTIQVEKCLAEWFTLDTMLLLFGDEKVREMVADKGECIKEYLNNYAKGIFYSSNAYDQYQALCKKLNMLELEDRKFDSETLKRETKPLPDYTMLQEESKKMHLKVKAFFSGDMVIPEPKIEQPEQSPVAEEENTTNLPLVDKNSQNALRRRIVCQHLNKVLPDLLRSLGLLSLQISADVRLLVNTFKLKPNNIMFKPIQWNLIAIIFIKLLSLRDKRLEYLLEQQTAYQHMQLLLLSYKQDGGYLDRLICWLTDIDRLLDTNDTQLTIE